MEIYLFYIFSIFTLASAIMVIGSRNPMHSILFLVLVFVNAAGLLILLGVEFLGMIFIIVYVGAIAVLFLFVIMMLDIKLIELEENVLRYLPIGALVALIFLVEIFLILDKDLISNAIYLISFVDFSAYVDSSSNMGTLGELLYTYFSYGFIVASLVLLVAMIGAIVLTLEKSTSSKRQDIFIQNSRSNQVLLYDSKSISSGTTTSEKK